MQVKIVGRDGRCVRLFQTRPGPMTCDGECLPRLTVLDTPLVLPYRRDSVSRVI